MRSGRKTAVQPLGTNTKREVENEGMIRAVKDFEKQTGQANPPKVHSNGSAEMVHSSPPSIASRDICALFQTIPNLFVVGS
jgi:hypothetical protein